MEIRALIKELGEEKTVLMSTHILPEVEATCSRVIVIADGEIVTDSPTEALTSDMSTVDIVIISRADTTTREAVVGVLRSVPGVDELEDAETSEADAFAFRLQTAGEDPRRALFDACVKNDLILLGLTRKQVSLEDTFRRLTT